MAGSDISYNAAKRERPATVNAILQIITLVMLGSGGFVAKQGYDDLADRLTEARIEAASLRTVVEGLSMQRDVALASDEATRARVQAIDLRLTALEVESRTKAKR